MATLILFDIDGTLTATSEADNRCYDLAFADVFGRPLPTTDWTKYTHVTDMGILLETVATFRAEPLRADEVTAFQEAYVHRLGEAAEAEPDGFAEVPGAKAIIEAASAGAARVGIATGGFRRSALFKLGRIGVDGLSYPAAFSDDGLSRADIARCAMDRAGGSWSDVVYVGDGLWDMHTAAELGMRFVALIHEKGPDRFLPHGVASLLDNYLCPDTFWRAVHSAAVPRPSR